MDDIASIEEIRAGKTTDIYFRRTVEILQARGLDRIPVKAEIFLKRFPDGYEWGIFAGIHDAVNILRGKSLNVKGLPEGSIFFEEEPVMVIEGPYGEFAELETAMLGYLCQSSGIATKSARVKRAAGGRLVLSFGARRMHPAISAFIERNAYLGGVDGVSTILSAEGIGIEPSGTIPHALILVMGDTLEAMRAFDEIMPPDVQRVCLIDTLQDEKFEAIRVAEDLGERLYAVRLDTPSSRRGDFRKLVEEVRWELDIRGHEDVKIFLSGGLKESDIDELKGLVDGFGVGTCISNAPVLDFSMDIVEVEGKNFAKRGKLSGAKEITACAACSHRFTVLAGEEKVCECGERTTSLYGTFLHDGEAIYPPESLESRRSRVNEGILQFWRAP